MRKTHEGAPRRQLGLVLLLALAAMMLIAAGCGGDDNSSSGGGGGGGGGSANTAEAEKLATENEKQPTSIPDKEPIGKPIPSGKKIAFIGCGPSTCLEFADVMKEGTDLLGWDLQKIATDGSPEKISNAIRSAIRSGADAIWLPAADPNTLAAPLKEAKEKGVFFAACCSLATMPDQVDFNTSTPEQNGPIGESLAAKVVADSGGDANTLYVNVSAFQILAEVGKTFKSEYNKLCPDCKYDQLEVPLTALGKDVPDRILSKLRANPDINYLVLSENNALSPGLLAALKSGGYGPDKLTVLGQGGDATVFQAVKDGDMLAITPPNSYDYSLSVVDAMARHFAGVDVTETVPTSWLVTKENMPDAGNANQFPFQEDYLQQWAKLWGKNAS